MDLGLAGKQVLITGGSKGIGLALAHAFAAEGADIIVVSRDKMTLESAAGDVARRHNARTAAHAADLSDPAQRRRLNETFPEVDILVNNAGAIPGGGIADISLERWQEAWALKVMGYIHLCQLYVAGMKARRSGTIINIIGMGGRAVRPDYICGAAGNGGLIAFTNALGAETPSYNVRVWHQPGRHHDRSHRATLPATRQDALWRREPLAGGARCRQVAVRAHQERRRSRGPRHHARRAPGALSVWHRHRYGWGRSMAALKGIGGGSLAPRRARARSGPATVPVAGRAPGGAGRRRPRLGAASRLASRLT
jgi:NAD(P)-dependent dehydrogenase (short-subunit alcohol dehydrogenase family)